MTQRSCIHFTVNTLNTGYYQFDKVIVMITHITDGVSSQDHLLFINNLMHYILYSNLFFKLVENFPLFFVCCLGDPMLC